MKLQYIDLQAFIKEKVQDVVLNKKATSIALGIAIARTIPLPSTAVQSAEEHYTFQVRAAAEFEVSCFNENIVVDVDLVLETARLHWLIRYYSAYPDLGSPLMSTGDLCFLTKLSGAGRFVNNETNAFCEANTDLMIVLVNRINRVLAEKQPDVAVDTSPIAAV